MSGVGQRLLDLTLCERDAFLWVFGDNPELARSTSAMGFRPDDVERVEPFRADRDPP